MIRSRQIDGCSPEPTYPLVISLPSKKETLRIAQYVKRENFIAKQILCAAPYLSRTKLLQLKHKLIKETVK